jgi:uroporphyrinogen-III decarboxylase
MELLGYEQALIGLATDSGKVHALLDRLTEASVTWAAAQARHGVDAVPVYTHTCGKIGDRLELMAETAESYGS